MPPVASQEGTPAMPSIYQPRITRYVGPDGRRCSKSTTGARKLQKRCRKWWGKYTDDAGTRHRVPLSSNRTAALRMLADLLEHAGDPYRRWAAVPLAGPDGHLAAYADHQRAEGTTEAQVRSVAGQLARVVVGCGWRLLADLDAAGANQWLHHAMRDGATAACPPGESFDTAAIARILSTGRAGESVTSRMRRLGFAPARRGRWITYPRAAVLILDLTQFDNHRTISHRRPTREHARTVEATMTTTPITGTVTHADLAELLKISVPGLYLLRSEGKVPEPDASLGPRTVRWKASTVQRWIEQGCPPPRSAASVRKQQAAAARPKRPIVISKQSKRAGREVPS